jgi:hypothetical protein
VTETSLSEVSPGQAAVAERPSAHWLQALEEILDAWRPFVR